MENYNYKYLETSNEVNSNLSDENNRINNELQKANTKISDLKSQLSQEISKYDSLVIEKSNLLDESSSVNKQLSEKISRLKMANKYANEQIDKLQQKDGPEFWLRGRNGAIKLKQLLNGHIDNALNNTQNLNSVTGIDEGKQKAENNNSANTGEFDIHAEENMYTSILEFLNNKDMYESCLLFLSYSPILCNKKHNHFLLILL